MDAKTRDGLKLNERKKLIFDEDNVPVQKKGLEEMNKTTFAEIELY